MCCAAVALQKKKNTWQHFNVIVKATQSKDTYERTQTTHIPERVLYTRRFSYVLLILYSLCHTLYVEQIQPLQILSKYRNKHSHYVYVRVVSQLNKRVYDKFSALHSTFKYIILFIHKYVAW